MAWAWRDWLLLSDPEVAAWGQCLPLEVSPSPRTVPALPLDSRRAPHVRRDPMPDPGVHPPLMPCRSGRPRGPSGDWPRKPVPLALLVEWPCHTLGSQVTIHADCVVRRHLPVFLWLLPGGCATTCAGPLLPAPSTQAWVVAALTTLLAPMGTHLRHGPAV